MIGPLSVDNARDHSSQFSFVHLSHIRIPPVPLCSIKAAIFYKENFPLLRPKKEQPTLLQEKHPSGSWTIEDRSAIRNITKFIVSESCTYNGHRHWDSSLTSVRTERAGYRDTALMFRMFLNGTGRSLGKSSPRTPNRESIDSHPDNGIFPTTVMSESEENGSQGGELPKMGPDRGQRSRDSGSESGNSSYGNGGFRARESTRTIRSWGLRTN
ncbi:hypothetical protein CEXT_574601 [Caerostris extrusa]|uniref:Uncharacterized protein n=1 Tax=Caerostris extrusa TaxID=172846 RepID=A0AAV4P349_CAEEX|nr:hypothetical protein CEXT_574601 [Caerostris extrusa]